MEIICPKCQEKRDVGKAMYRLIQRGKYIGCKSCASKGNKSHLGQKLSLETKQKMSLAHIGRKKSLAHNLAISKGRKGIQFTEEHRKKLSESRKEYFAKGGKGWNWIEDRTLLKDDHKDRGGQLHRDWSRNVKFRDSWNCKIANEDCEGRMEVHHILGWKEYPELRYEINNGITLCHAHHPKKREEEKELAPIFQELVKGEYNFGNK